MHHDPHTAKPIDPAVTGIQGLDTVLHGGLARDRAYLIQGDPGSGKTTLGLHFCMAGAAQGERVLYLTTCESEAEIQQLAQSHGWNLEGVNIHYQRERGADGEGIQQSVFHPAEVELPKAIESLLAVINQADPQRLVIDSLSEMRLMADNPRWFRRKILSLKENLARRRCTTLFCDDLLAADQPVHSVVHGVIELQQLSADYGPDRRRLRVSKMRARDFSSGYHDFRILTGGMQVYPRLVAAEHRGDFGLQASRWAS